MIVINLIELRGEILKRIDFLMPSCQTTEKEFLHAVDRAIAAESECDELKSNLAEIEAKLPVAYTYADSLKNLERTGNALMYQEQQEFKLTTPQKEYALYLHAKPSQPIANNSEPVAYAFYTAAGDIRIWWSAKAYDIYSARDWAKANNVDYSELVSLYDHAQVTPNKAEVPVWQPIETAPKDKLIDIWINHKDGSGVRWSDCYYDQVCDDWRTITASGHLVFVPARCVTHWMNSPLAPLKGE